MINSEEFDRLYENALKPKLVELDALRKKVSGRILKGLLMVLLGVALGVLCAWLDSREAEKLHIMLALAGAIAFVIAGVIVSVTARKPHKEYRRRYKEEVVREVVKAINPEWTYESEQGISEGEYRESGLFPTKHDRYRCDDLVYGTMEKTDFRCSEVHSEKKVVSYDKDGHRQERWETIFHGLFFHADFNKHFHGKTFVEPDFAERFLGGLGASLQKISDKGELVKLENVEFEKLFVVHGSDQIEARYILTPTMMEAIVAIAKAWKFPVRLSFVGSRVYFAIHFMQNLFEPKTWKSCVNIDEARKLFRLFKTNEVIIRELQLNTRIWTKD
jgi:hypothetical protein